MNISSIIPSIMNNSESASVTIELDPPSQGGSPLNYTITTTPDLISGPPPVTTSTSTTITINYNTDYTITVTASNCVGNASVGGDGRRTKAKSKMLRIAVAIDYSLTHLYLDCLCRSLVSSST